MRFSYVVQYRKVDDKQFLVKIDHLLFVDGFNIDWSIALYKSLRRCYSFGPVDSVITGMHIFYNEGKIILIVPIEVTECDYYIQQSIVLLFPASAFCLVFLAFKYIVIMCLFIYTDSSVNPYRKCGKKLLVFLAPFFRELGLYFI